MNRRPLSQRATSRAIDLALSSLSAAARVHPHARLGGVRLVRDVPYLPTGDGAHLLDVYQPEGPARGAVLYVHGGGFRILSKDTHWMMALAFARRGYVVFSINYRLAPAHVYPAPLIDVLAAWSFVARHASRFGADPARLVLAGESAGANLVTAAACAHAFARLEPFAAVAPALPVSAVVPLCGILDVTRPERFHALARTSPWVQQRIELVCHGYAPHACPGDLASPLSILESDAEPARPLPPFAASAGDADPIVDDTRRLDAALAKRGVARRVTVHPGEAHAFQALFWREEAKRAWEGCFSFLEEHVVARA